MASRKVLRTQPVREMRIMMKGGILLEASIPENLVIKHDHDNNSDQLRNVYLPTKKLKKWAV